MPAQLFARLHAASSDARLDGAGTALLAATTVVVGLGGVELAGARARAALPVAHAGHGIQGRGQHHAGVPIGRAQAHSEGRAAAVNHKMALRARFAAIRRVRTGLGGSGSV